MDRSATTYGCARSPSVSFAKVITSLPSGPLQTTVAKSAADRTLCHVRGRTLSGAGTPKSGRSVGASCLTSYPRRA
eukprot:3380304-Prymnesium_polylepis.2